MRRRLGVAAAALCLLAPATPAHASGRDVLKDCSTNGRLTKKYSQAEYRSALANIPSDLDEYTDCRDQIRKAQLGLGGGDGSAGGGAAPTPAENAAARDPYAGLNAQQVADVQTEIRQHQSQGGAVQRIEGASVSPGALAYHRFSAVSSLPIPLAVLALLVVVASAAVALHLLNARVRARRAGP